MQIYLTIVSASRCFKKLWMVAVLDVPESPTRRTGLFIFTICSRSQLVLVVSVVGTEDEYVKKDSIIINNTTTTSTNNNNKCSTCVCACTLTLTVNHYQEYQRILCQGDDCIQKPVNSMESTSPVYHQSESHTEWEGNLYG